MTTAQTTDNQFKEQTIVNNKLVPKCLYTAFSVTAFTFAFMAYHFSSEQLVNNCLFVLFSMLFIISLSITDNKWEIFKVFQDNPFKYMTRSIGASFLLCGIFIEFIMTRCYPIFNDVNGKVVLEWYKSTGAWTFLSALMLVPPSIVIWYWRYIHKETDIKQKEAEIKLEQENYALERLKHIDSLKTTEAKAFDDRYIKAIELFGKPETEIQLGVIYELEYIAKNSKKHFLTIINVLCAFVRHHRVKYVRDYMRYIKPELPSAIIQRIEVIVGGNHKVDWVKLYNDIREYIGGEDRWHEFKNALDSQRFQRQILIQAVINTISNLNRYNEDTLQMPLIINLTDSELSDVNFHQLYLKNVDFSNSILIGAIFERATLEQAVFDNSYLEGASFDYANMKKARLGQITIRMLKPRHPDNLIKFNNTDLSQTDIACSEQDKKFYMYNLFTKFPY